MKFLINGLVTGISACFISFLIGMMIHSGIKKFSFYTHLTTLNFLGTEKRYHKFGIKRYIWFLKNTFVKIFNQKISLKGENVDLLAVRKEMTKAEIEHLIGFLFVTAFAIFKVMDKNNITIGLGIMIANVFCNLYPSLVQQYNKIKLDKRIQKEQF